MYLRHTTLPFHRSALFTALTLSFTFFAPVSYALDDPERDPAKVTGHEIERIRIQGEAQTQSGQFVSASQGWVSGDTLVERPMLRTGEMLEFIPGMMVTQHSGSGKANQYFLRGFNLDHGTDFAVNVDGMPVNMRSHGHGQGYSDLNFVIPEMVDNLSYFKGTYYANIGDFSSAGGAYFSSKDNLDNNLLLVTLGEDNYRRAVTLNSASIGKGTAIAALEYQTYDGPWSDINEDVKKKNANLRYIVPLFDGELAISGMAYENSWNSADQVPERAIQSGLIDRLGSIDTDVGGESSRYSLSAQYKSDTIHASLYAIDTDLTLFSNFTYFLDNPETGDQFEQADDRKIYGGELSTTLPFTMPFSGSFSEGSAITFGGQWRYDDIDNVGLYRTQDLQRLGTIREDAIESSSYAAFAQSTIMLSDALSLSLGGRYDYFDIDVDSQVAANSGSENDGMFSLKAGLKYQVSDTVTTFANIGQGYHSNDARGVTITQDPTTGEAVEPAPLLVRSLGYETGINWTDDKTYNVSAALWQLELDSELVYVGDAGFTEASRPSKRYGVELSAYYWLNHHLTADVEAAYTKARFSDTVDGEGDHIDGTVPIVVSAGATWYQRSNQQGFSYTLRARYLSSRTVDSFDVIEPPSTFLLNTQVAYQHTDWQVGLEVLNLLDSDAHDIDYYYASRLPGEPEEGVEDLHYHPVEPRTVRLTFGIKY
ncbi:TonB-dependent receptor [Alteromonas sp. 1_MG-2023]|uniref:TonB-dependent receptor n=1 Tax=Alteromonas sp. 1_MG-2023 TaxID=3062669 RepID=UPI0026E2DA16|nr:TonB-dependent receptor [Alteromonas sp. 1_MG-2023]MDO6566601.1 TonB-dependent receptor [Alteromonas sp. 1_MG-2023]